jgi:hypothetical protein
VRTPFVLVVIAVALFAVPVSAAAVSPTLRMTIVHVVRGCHVWALGSKQLGPAAKLTVKRGTRIEIRLNCPMDFDFKQVAGPKLALGSLRSLAGGLPRRVGFAKPGIYRLTAKNVQSAEEAGLQILGTENTLALTVVVR